METKKHELLKDSPYNLIIAAFWSLIRAKPSIEISIDELSHTAGVSRRTFYRNFKSTDEIWELIFQERSDYFISECKITKPKNFKTLVKTFFDFWVFEKEFLNILLRNRKLDAFLQFFLSETRKVMSDAIIAKNESEVYQEYVPYFIVNGLCGILVKWLEDGAKTVPEVMVQVAAEIMTSDAFQQK